MEAAFLIPWTVILTALLIILLFYMHNVSWYKTAGLEAALAGNQYIAGAGGTGRAGFSNSDTDANAAGLRKAENSANARIKDQAVPGSSPDVEIDCTYGKTEVRFSGQRYAAFSELFKLSVTEQVKKVRPVPIVRGRWMVQNIMNGGSDGS
ncbi:MAG: hypothetical protein HUJ73_05470 [Eubacterium sp.]|nr:hypothetical protein [Eubacterium sp.]